MKYLFLFNDSPYGSQRAYNGLRLALSLSKQADVDVFLLGDGVTTALNGLTPANTDYNTAEMLRQLAQHGVGIRVCKTCLEARGISDTQLIPEAKRSTMDDLTAWVEDAEKILNF